MSRVFSAMTGTGSTRPVLVENQDEGADEQFVVESEDAPFAEAGSAGGSSRTDASACSGRRTVREPTIESYCSNAHLREATLDEPSSATRTSPGSDDDSTTGGAG